MIADTSQVEALQMRPALESSRGLFLMTSSGDAGGTERQFAVMTEALGQGHFRLETGCLRREGVFFENLPHIHEFPLGGSFVSWQAQKSRVALARYLRTQHIDVAHSFDFYSNLMLLPVARMAGVVARIGSMRQLGDRLTRTQLKALVTTFRCFADRVVCNSRAAADRLLELGVPAQKPIIIPNALPEECFRAIAPALPRRADELRIGLVARMNEKVKNHPALLRATAVLLQEFPSMELVLVGDGPLRPELQKMAADLGIAGSVRFLGQRNDIPAILASLDISVLTSFSESMPNAILEAMASGLPVVATRVGGSSEVVCQGETGFLVDSGDDSQLVEALRTLLQSSALRKRFGSRGREMARAQFGIGNVQKQYEELYAAVLREKQSAR